MLEPERKPLFTDSDLDQFIGTTQYYRHWSGLPLTEGVHFLAEHGAAWLVDAIASHHLANINLAGEDFVCWTLTKGEGSSATLKATDGNYRSLATQEIEYTDIPVKRVSVWFEGGVLLLPSEH